MTLTSLALSHEPRKWSRRPACRWGVLPQNLSRARRPRRQPGRLPHYRADGSWSRCVRKSERRLSTHETRLKCSKLSPERRPRSGRVSQTTARNAGSEIGVLPVQGTRLGQRKVRAERPPNGPHIFSLTLKSAAPIICSNFLSTGCKPNMIGAMAGRQEMMVESLSP